MLPPLGPFTRHSPCTEGDSRCFKQVREPTFKFLLHRRLFFLPDDLFVTARSTSPTAMASKNVQKRSKKKRKNGSDRRLSTGRSWALSEPELVDHVSNLYIFGPGGILYDKMNKERRNNDQRGNFLNMLDQHPALVLNADFQPMSYLPLSMWHWQEAIKAIFAGKVTVVDVYPDVSVKAASLEIPLPSVIALNDYVPGFQQRPAFTKRNVFLRDEYKCQYCDLSFHTRDLTLDHVVPRSMGGRLNWENAVTSCSQCNGRKGCLPVSELRHVGMKLNRKPFVPTQYQLASIAGRMLPRRVHPTWEPYLEGISARRAKGGGVNQSNGGMESTAGC